MCEIQNALECISICKRPQFAVERAILRLSQRESDMIAIKWMREPSRSECVDSITCAIRQHKIDATARIAKQLMQTMRNIDMTVSMHLVEHFSGKKLDRNIAGTGWRTMYRRRSEAIDVLDTMLNDAVMRYITLTTNHSDRVYWSND